MRFTKIPLIATLMAVALSLLIVLPALAEDDTRGFREVAHLEVSVLKTGTTTVGTDLDPDANRADSSFNYKLYVSNDGKAHNRVYVNASGAGLEPADLTAYPGADGILSDNDDNTTETTDNEWCAVATVTNVTYGKKITVALDDTPDSAAGETRPSTIEATANFGAYFEVIKSGNPSQNATCNFATTNDNAKRGQIPARHGDVLRIEVEGLSSIVELTVDAKGPEFSEISPDDGVFRGSQSVKIKFLVTDNDSGLAYDGELDYSQGDNDPRPYNTDGDQHRSEPRSTATGASRDINVQFNGDDPEDDVSDDGSRGWKRRGNVDGVSYAMDMNVVADPGVYPWYLEATDRAGNTARTDANSGKSGDQDFTVTVDVASPEFKDARTGIAYDADKKTEIVDRSSIAVTFKDTDGDFDALSDADADKFLVEGHEVTGATILMDKSNCSTTAKPIDAKDESPKALDGTCIRQTPQSRLYLQLAEALAPDETPLVSMFGGAVRDMAGNPSNQDEVRPADRIAPAVTVTLTSAVGDRPVVRNNGEITIAITSDEELRQLPRVWFAPVMDNGSTAESKKWKLGSPRPAPRLRAGDGENTWMRTYTNNDIGNADNVYAVIVVVEDDDANIGMTTGWTRGNKSQPAVGDKADLAKLEAAGLIVEVDKNLPAPEFSLAPETDTDTKKTESANPFITIDFAGEKGEYGDYDASGVGNFGDSHDAVTITSITLNGNDVMDHTAAVTSRKYTLAAQDLSTANYELKVTGVDDAGNDVTASYKFESVARKPYKVNLIPGWNLVSVPGTPLDSGVQSVMGATAEAEIVLAYQDDAWLTAVNDNGTWRGTLTDIVGGYGYWVQTTAFESISTLIPETDTSSVLPTADVIEGWNLLGVVDVRQNAAGKAPSGGGKADDYFGNVKWKVAYSFDTSNNSWSKSIPGDDAADAIKNGKGYWVWSTEAGKLVP